mgnify:CR=1 FL=1
MLADKDTTPKTLPPGFSFIEGEPEFDPGSVALKTGR